MALTQQQIEERKNALLGNTGSFSSTTKTPGQLRLERLGLKNDSLKDKSSKIGEVTDEKPPQGLLGKTAGTINKGFDTFAGLAKKTGIPQAIGGVVGAAGGLFGATAGAIGEAGIQTTQGVVPGGKGFDAKKIFESAMGNAKDTAKFGFNIGQQGTIAAPLGGAGRVVNLAVAYGQGYQGLEDTIEGIKQDDPVKAFEGATALATSIVGSRGVIKGKGILIDPEVAASIRSLPKNVRRSAYDSYRTKAIKSYSEIMNLSKKQKQIEVELNKNTPEFLVDEGITLKADGNRLQTKEARLVLQERINPLESVLDNALEGSSAKFNIETARKQIIKNIQEKKNIAAIDKKQMINNINEVVDAEIELRGSHIFDAQSYNGVKRGLWNKAFDPQKSKIVNSEVHNAGNVIKTSLERKIKDKPIQAINEKIGRYADAIKLLRALEGNIIPGGRLGTLGARLLGGIVGGFGGGGTGALVGAEVAGRVSKGLRNPLLRTKTKQSILKKLEPDKRKGILKTKEKR